MVVCEVVKRKFCELRYRGKCGGCEREGKNDLAAKLALVDAESLSVAIGKFLESGDFLWRIAPGQQRERGNVGGAISTADVSHQFAQQSPPHCSGAKNSMGSSWYLHISTRLNHSSRLGMLTMIPSMLCLQRQNSCPVFASGLASPVPSSVVAGVLHVCFKTSKAVPTASPNGHR